MREALAVVGFRLLASAAALAALCACGSAATAPPCQGDAIVCGGNCVEPKSDVLNCGRCGNACAAGSVCTAGACAVTCATGLLTCSRACVDPQTDRDFCGATDCTAGTHACLPGQLCAGGACTQTCAPGELTCPGRCVDPATALDFCGATDCTPGTHVCAAGKLCSQGACAVTCAAGELTCNGKCVDPQSDRGFCGATDCTAGTHACAAGQLCNLGVCAVTCGAGQLTCAGACVDPQTSSAHCGAALDCLGANAGVACAANQACVSGSCAQLCAFTPLDLDTPISTGAPAFATASQPAAYQPAATWGATPFPRATNAAWENLVLGAGNSRIDMVPYQLKAQPTGLALAQAAPQITSMQVNVPDVTEAQFGAAQFNGATTHVISATDHFSVTLRYSAGAGTMTTPLVGGMPYVTAIYSALTPLLSQLNLQGVNGSTTKSVSGTRFQLALGDGSAWVLYASAPITFNWTTTTMTATATYSGTLRLAHLGAPGDAAALDAHAGAVPTGGALQISTGCDTAQIKFTWTSTGSGPLLMTALPHHLALLQGPVLAGPTFATLLGKLQTVEGATWTMRLPLSTVTWSAPRAVLPAHLAAVTAALATDKAFVPDATTVANDPYFGGKQLAKLARLVVIADDLGDSATASTLRARLGPLSAAWLDGTNGNKLVYDTTWGGLVTSNGIANGSADFGQGHYNDHHFHYGYHLYAAAVMARFDPSFIAAHKAGLEAMVRDIANPSPADGRFPRFRYLDFYRGHSWANGLNDWPDGTNQESTSEAANAWYGMQLYALAAGDARLYDLARVLLALEVTSARAYWQIPAASTVYPAAFAQNYCVGRLFSSQATFSTWFGGNAEYVYGIQMLPFTPATEELLSSQWLDDAWPTISSRTTAAAQSWLGLMSMGHAASNAPGAREAAWNEVSPLTSYDDGNSQTNTLWWIATRP